MFCVTLAIYYALNIAYSMGLKALSLIDIFIVSSGFVFRVIGGGIICNIEISHWLFIMTFLLALFIALAKRRDDVLIELRSGEKMRHSISGYTLEFVDSTLSILCGVLIVSYILYITSSDIGLRIGNRYAFSSAIFVIMGIFRYLQITLVEKGSGSPTKILINDRFLQIVILLWVLFFGALLYSR